MGKKSKGNAPPPVDPSVGQANLRMTQLAEDQWNDWQTNVFPWLKSEQERANTSQQKEYDRWFNFTNDAYKQDSEFQRSQYDDYKKFMEGERDWFRGQQDKQDKIADEYYGRMKEKFYPLEDDIVRQATEYDTEGNRERIARDAMGDVATQFSNARQADSIRRGSFGLQPTSGAALAGGNFMDIQEAGLQAAAATRARDAAEQLGWAKKMDAIGLGKGLVGAQASSTGLAFGAGGQAMGAGQNVFNTGSAMSGQQFGNAMALGGQQYGNATGMINSRLSNANQFGGMQMGMYGQNQGMWGNVGNLGMQRSNYNMQGWKAQQEQKANSSAGWGKLAGGLAGSFLGPIGSAVGSQLGGMISDERTKKNVKPVGTTPGGATVYEYEYKKAFKPFTGEGKFVGVMAQDLEKTQPEAVNYVGGLKVVDYSKVK